MLSTRETALYWAGLAGHRRPPAVREFAEVDGDTSTTISQKTWSKGQGYTVSLITMHGSGHVFPAKDSSIPAEYAAIVGKAAGDIEGADEIIRFFRENL